LSHPVTSRALFLIIAAWPPLLPAGGCTPRSMATERQRQDASVTTVPSLVRSALGDAIIDSIARTIRAEVAPLKIVSANEAERHTLAGADRIVGYPVASALRPLSPIETKRLVEIALRDDQYDSRARIRCRNTRLIGVRFSDADPVELTLGVPCNQVTWAFRRDDKIERWGAVISKEASAGIEAAVRSAFP
jgi:hypothetical protein